MDQKTVPLTDIQIDPDNPNQGTSRGRDLIRSSLAEFGFIEPGILDANLMPINGNQRTTAAQEVGFEDAVVIEYDGDKPLYIQYKKFDLHSEDPVIRANSRRLAYLLNRSAEVNLSWNPDKVEADIMAGLDLSGIFTQREALSLIESKLDTPAPDDDSPDTEIEHLIQIRCSEAALAQLLPTLELWQELDEVTVEIT